MNLQLSRMYFQNAKIKRTIDALYCGVYLLTPKAQKLADSSIAMETKTEKAFAVIFTLHVEKQLFERALPLLNLPTGNVSLTTGFQCGPQGKTKSTILVNSRTISFQQSNLLANKEQQAT